MDEQVISFARPTGGLSRLSDQEFLQNIQWRNVAPTPLMRASRQGDVPAFNRKWAKRLAQRTDSRHLSGKRLQPTVPWSKFAFGHDERTQRAVAFLEDIFQGIATRRRTKSAIRSPKLTGHRRTKPAGKQSKWLNRLESCVEEWLAVVGQPSAVNPLELLSLLEILSSKHSGVLSDRVFWSLWRHTLAAGVEFVTTLDTADEKQLRPDQVLLLRGEIPWQLGLLFADIEGAHELTRTSKRVLCRSLLDQTDTDGTPNAELLEQLPLWLAPLVRSAEFAARFGQNLWPKEALVRFEELVSVVAPMCRLDGQLALSNGSSYQVLSLLRNASRVAGFGKREPPRRYLTDVAGQDGGRKPAKKSAQVPKRRAKQDWPVTQSDWAKLACLRSEWASAANALVVAHHGTLPLIDLSARGIPVFSGEWGIDLHVDGKSVQIANDWECVCWHSDEDADYLELQLAVDDGLVIVRQALLSRKDDFAILADVVWCAGARRIEHTCRFPLVSGFQAASSVDSRECVLQAHDQVVRVFPVGLPQDRVQSTRGGFGPFADDLVVKQVSGNQGLYVPVVFDWKPSRRRTAADWKTLTITEAGSAASQGAAAGHRLRIGKHHLFLYRSLRQPETPRAVLGQHIAHETLIGTIEPSGDVTPILLVET